ncbi:MAG TPA: carboxypeptidase regulatory-like domain-containing protein [Vicinamibacterales bacterium]
MKGFGRAALLVLALLCPWAASAQGAADATFHVVVVDPSGAVIVGARVTLTPIAPDATAQSLDTGPDGEARLTSLVPGRYTIRVESPGFETATVREARVRRGENRREVKLAIARLAETVDVGRDARERGADPRSDAFATVLGPDAINELPDDPDEMERILNDMAGPGAVMRVNGFRGGKLPPKDQIAQIRFHRNMFAADTHEPGFMSIDIITKPGLENWRGATNIGVRDAALNARNPFAPEKGDEHFRRLAFSLSGPLWKKRTSLALSAETVDAFDSKTIVAALPTGYFADSVQKPNTTLNWSARLEHALNANQILRFEGQRNHNQLDNQGIGDYDLFDRAYRQVSDEALVRGSMAGSIRKSLYNELRFQWRSLSTAYTPASLAPTVMVLNAFNSGGAQIGGQQDSNELQLADDLDIATGKHAIRAGFQIDGGRYDTNVARNAGGTFTFSSLDAYNAAQPTTFTRNVGDPEVAVSQWQGAVYVQDDYRLRRELTVSGGIRVEAQQHIGGVHPGPRGGIAWSPFKDGRTTIRAGAGVFFDWFDAATYEQAVQLDGTHQRISTITSPGYPIPSSGANSVILPAGRVELASNLSQPSLREANAAVERQLPGNLRVSAMFVARRGVDLLRGVDVNAPLADGTRPYPLAGTITSVESIASSSFNAMFVNVNYSRPERRIFVAANYALARSINDTDGAFNLPADSHDLAAERGPALSDARHRFTSLANFPLFRKLTLGTAIRLQSALPYNITTGFDDNHDTVSNDRPVGVTRNTGRGGTIVDVGSRLSWTVGFGGAPRTGPGGPQVAIVRGGDADPLRSMPSGASDARYRVELYLQGYNLTNHTNATNFSGVQTSPFFGQATAASAARRLELGARLVF